MLYLNKLNFVSAWDIPEMAKLGSTENSEEALTEWSEVEEKFLPGELRVVQNVYICDVHNDAANISATRQFVFGEIFFDVML